MLILKFAFLIFFVLRCLSRNRQKDKSVIIINDEIKTIKSPIHCILAVYFVLRNELYKTCVQHITKKQSEIHVIVQKNVEDTWKTQEKLFSDLSWVEVPSIFNFINKDEAVIIICKYKDKSKEDGAICERWSTSTGENYTKEDVAIDKEVFNNKNIESYTSHPLKISNKEYFLICGVRYFDYENDSIDNFISCSASEDKGRKWTTKILINYKQYKSRMPHSYVKPVVLNDEFGLYFYSRRSTSHSSREYKYMKCTKDEKHTNDNEYKFNCSDVNVTRSNKILQNITKLNGHYLTNYILRDNFKECYLYYSDENAIVIKPKIQNYNLSGCYEGSFINLNESKSLFIYSTGYGVQNIHSLYCLKYD
ncbi:hypothetical protein, conserved [Plasmodium gonderi]|uniref:Cysteine-rich protective antigen 6 bladed domain-containing protein n=1 Tax=Plasmodium gonderi TaxID=77519 RepID=A0A1Y1JET1_PLAGO|nr:hypothetical protein, conserved [Plasmodium gonderi]GAW79855.1 hypothetical protein, conserved [Plasmodium gonderi]